MALREVSPDPREERQRRTESHCTGKNILNNIHSLNKKQKTQATRGRSKNGPIQSPADKCYLHCTVLQTVLNTSVCIHMCVYICMFKYNYCFNLQNGWQSSKLLAQELDPRWNAHPCLLPACALRQHRHDPSEPVSGSSALNWEMTSVPSPEVCCDY